VGGVSGRPAREAERSDPFEPRDRGGGKHPVSRMAAPFAGFRRNEDLGRSASYVRRGLLLGERAHRRQGVLSGRRGGERRQLAELKQQRALDPKVPNKNGRRRGHVLRSVQRPVHVNRHYTAAGQLVVGGAVGMASRSGKPAQAGGTGTEVRSNGRSAARRAHTASARKAACRVRKGRGLRPSSLRGFRELQSQCSHVVVVAEVDRRRLASNTLARSAPKRVAARVNGGLARGHHRR
jgi:hypothetical protein